MNWLFLQNTDFSAEKTPNRGLGNHNYCRNPKAFNSNYDEEDPIYRATWCYVNDTNAGAEPCFKDSVLCGGQETQDKCLALVDSSTGQNQCQWTDSESFQGCTFLPAAVDALGLAEYEWTIEVPAQKEGDQPEEVEEVEEAVVEDIPVEHKIIFGLLVVFILFVGVRRAQAKKAEEATGSGTLEINEEADEEAAVMALLAKEEAGSG